jgi:NitT/TauT family transport system ATP-binding protein
MSLSQPAAAATPHDSGAIAIAGVTKTYDSAGRKTTAISNINLDIEPGEFVVLLGRSGCGKTTLLRSLAGLLAPSAGSIAIDGQSLYDARGKVQRPVLGNLGFVFQDANLLPWRPVWKNIALPLEVQKLSKAARRRRATELAQMVKLEGLLDHLPRALSGGMRQRVAILRALAPEPSILLMDEPFSALDAMTRDELNLSLQDIWLRQRKTVVLVTHSINEAVFLADRIVLLSPHPGRIQRIIPVSFPRSRPLSLARDPEFQRLAGELREELGE